MKEETALKGIMVLAGTMFLVYISAIVTAIWAAIKLVRWIVG